MDQIFIAILNNSLRASILIAAILIVRLLICRAPKYISCALWGLAAVRLALPFDIESVLSLIPSPKPIPADIAYSEAPHIETGFRTVNQVINPVIEAGFAPKPAASVNPLQVVISAGTILWLAGTAVLLVYSLVSWLVLKRKVAASQRLFENVFVCDEAAGPFILGIIRPKVYLPSGLPDQTAECVLAHERAHLKRLDHLWKPLGFLILSVYWFNPLCWISYLLLCKDMELACDEKVTGNKDKNWKAAYCQALLDCSANRRIISACPVAFGEVAIKTRIKSVLHYKKPAIWVAAAAVAAGVVIAVCFMTDPKSPELLADTATPEEAPSPPPSAEPVSAAKEEASASAEISDPSRTPEGEAAVTAEGSFDNIMGHSGSYIFYAEHPTNGYYFAEDGTILANVWGTAPEDVGIVDLDGDGKNELISDLVWGDGGTAVVVYKEFTDGIRYAYCDELMDLPYENTGVGSLQTEYLKETNAVKFSYWVEGDPKQHTTTRDILLYSLTWYVPDWLSAPEQESAEAFLAQSNQYWGDERDWPCGSISQITETANGRELSISQKYFVHSDDTGLIAKLGLTEEDFPSGFDIVPSGNTFICPLSEDCTFIFIDWNRLFDGDSRVETYDDVHVATKDYAVFDAYLEDCSDKDKIFFYGLQDGVIQTIFETWLP